MRWIWMIFIAMQLSAQTVTLQGNVKNGDGSGFNGTATLSLTQSSISNTCTTPTQVVPIVRKSVKIINGVWTPTQMIPTDCLRPRVAYVFTLADAGNKQLVRSNWYIPALASGVIDVGMMQTMMLASGITVSIPQAINSTPAGNQVITQPVGTALSINNLTVTGTCTGCGGGGTGSGTVGSGSTGQFAQYPAGGTSVTGHTLDAGDIPALAESQITGLVTDLAGKAQAAGSIAGEVGSFNATCSQQMYGIAFTSAGTMTLPAAPTSPATCSIGLMFRSGSYPLTVATTGGTAFYLDSDPSLDQQGSFIYPSSGNVGCSATMLILFDGTAWRSSAPPTYSTGITCTAGPTGNVLTGP